MVCKEDPDILVLQEIKRDEEVNRRFVGSIWNSRFKEWVLLPSMRRFVGILVVWDVRRVNISSQFLFMLYEKERWIGGS